MQRTSSQTRDENTIQASITILSVRSRRFSTFIAILPICLILLGDVMAIEQIVSGYLSMDYRRSSGHSCKLENSSDRGARKRVDPLRDARPTRTEPVTGKFISRLHLVLPTRKFAK